MGAFTTPKKLIGMEKVIMNLRREIAMIKGRSMAGLIEGAMIIRRDMDRTPPMIPLDTGNLRASWFTESFYVTGDPGLKIGFSANYATFVHEMLDNSGTKKINWSRPGSGPKFFQAALFRNTYQVLEAIRNNAKILSSVMTVPIRPFESMNLARNIGT